jgi:hypothetical protein
VHPTLDCVIRVEVTRQLLDTNDPQAPAVRPRVLVVGPEGLGKSTTINAILRDQMKEDTVFSKFSETRVLPDRNGQANKAIRIGAPMPWKVRFSMPLYPLITFVIYSGGETILQ